MNEVKWAPTDVSRFETAINKAKENKEETLVFNGNEYAVAYAVHLLDYLKELFHGSHSSASAH